jgi:hypothetical protein
LIDGAKKDRDNRIGSGLEAATKLGDSPKISSRLAVAVWKYSKLSEPGRVRFEHAMRCRYHTIPQAPVYTLCTVATLDCTRKYYLTKNEYDRLPD